MSLFSFTFLWLSLLSLPPFVRSFCLFGSSFFERFGCLLWLLNTQMAGASIPISILIPIPFQFVSILFDRIRIWLAASLQWRISLQLAAFGLRADYNQSDCQIRRKNNTWRVADSLSVALLLFACASSRFIIDDKSRIDLNVVCIAFCISININLPTFALSYITANLTDN